jgi:hypothetical protein
MRRLVALLLLAGCGSGAAMQDLAMVDTAQPVDMAMAAPDLGPCGSAVGQPCCTGNVCDSTPDQTVQCNTGGAVARCENCGNPGQTCCGSMCRAVGAQAYTCVVTAGSTCVVCGKVNQECCAGMCEGGLACNGGSCH